MPAFASQQYLGRYNPDFQKEEGMKNRSRILVAVFGILLPLVCVGQYQRSDDDQRRDYDNNHGYGNADDRGGRLSAEDQSRFDSYYSRWLDYRQTNNRDQMASMEQRMRDVMVHNSIPPNTEFSQIASRSAGQNSRRNIPRFSSDDARRFSSYYSRWQNYRQTNNRDQARSMEGRMRDVMSRYNLPGDTSYDEVMSMLNGHNR
jgi:hypothetical protein